MIRITLRLPEKLYASLRYSARSEDRSQNGQIVYILRRFFGLAPGTRVKVTGPAAGLRLQSTLGTVLRRESEDYYIIRMDLPAIGDTSRELPEIREDIDNLIVLDGPGVEE